jgi:hypothetical protein
LFAASTTETKTDIGPVLRGEAAGADTNAILRIE